jgi:hypothetical protein
MNGVCGAQSDLRRSDGPRPASEEGKLELTEEPWSKTVAEGIPEGFHFRAPWKGVAEGAGSG